MIAHAIDCADARHRTLRGLRSSLKGLGAIEESVDPVGFLLFRVRLDDSGASHVRQLESRRGRGFSVMRSPERGHSKDGRRIARQAPLDRPVRCSDAAAPVGKEASQPTQG